jgi:hypothetical protein
MEWHSLAVTNARISASEKMTPSPIRYSLPSALAADVSSCSKAEDVLAETACNVSDFINSLSV